MTDIDNSVASLKRYLNRRYRDKSADKHELHSYDVGTRSETVLRSEDIERLIMFVESVRK